MSAWTCSDCRQGLHYHDRYPDGSDAGCPSSPDTTTPCACRVVVHEGTDWRARATVAEAERDRLAGEVETLRARLAAVEAVADEWERTLTVAQWRRQAAKRLRAALEVTPDA